MRVRILGQFWHISLVLLWLFEAFAIVASCALALQLSNVSMPLLEQLWFASLFTVTTILAMVAFGLFSRRQRERPRGIVLRIGLSVLLAAALIAWLLPVALMRNFPVHLVVIAAIASLLSVLAVRLGAGRMLDERVMKRRVIVLGCGVRAASIARLRRRTDTRGFNLLMYLDTKSEGAVVANPRLLEHGETLLGLAQEVKAEEIVVAIDDRRRNLPVRDLIDCRLAGIEIIDIVNFLERETGKVHLDLLHPSWIIFAEGFRHDPLRLFCERAVDVVLGGLMLLVLAPFMLMVALAIKISEGPFAPVFYAQPRVGLKGKIFNVLKFRSMRTDAESDGKARWASTNDSRITRIGAFIRKARIDELPQLINVLKGEMSLVGPRPERPEFVERLAEVVPFYKERQSVKPGLTGWAQVCHSYGASENDAAAKLQYDLFYVKNHGLLFDLMILLRTLEIVLFGKGAR